MFCYIASRTFSVWIAFALSSWLFLWDPVRVNGHEGEHVWTQHERTKQTKGQRRTRLGRTGKGEANQFFKAFTSLVAKWPLSCHEDLIAQSAREHQFIHDDPKAPDLLTLRSHRSDLLKKLTTQMPTCRIRFQDGKAKLLTPQIPISVCVGIPTLVLIQCMNESEETFVVRPLTDSDEQTKRMPELVHPERELLMSFEVNLKNLNRPTKRVRFQIEDLEGQVKGSITIPLKFIKPAKLQLRLIHDQGPQTGKDVPGRITVSCSDGICRYGGRFASKSTFTDKPIIYPPVGTWQKLPFFYSDRLVEMEVPPGTTKVTFERGFEHYRTSVDLKLKPGEMVKVERPCKRIIDMASLGWISGDTHVHWVTNAWNVDEPLELLSMAQRAEDLKVANNLTLLQRYANQAFVKPSQAPMGPVLKFSNKKFHMQMGEEYRNEDLYGHLCLLNIDWLVQPIGTGSIIAGPDALDYPINRTAIEACRVQGGISIEAHGTGGNKDVPVNVIHRLTDSLDQMEPTMYYRLLDCGFQVPLTNGSDHPARTLGAARAYVHVPGEFSYERWIEGIRRGRTFTTSGPLLFLEVNGRNIGESMVADRKERLQIKARVISRDPIGLFQIVSNGKVLYSHKTNETRHEMKLSLPAKESRWIVARCSNRNDGREEFGFGNFNAITGSGIAHTSPIYVKVDGLPRFDAAAADFWRERMRQHTHEIRGRGRFADESQRNEAVGYIEQGIQMFQELKSQVKLARSKTESFPQLKSRLANIVHRMGPSTASSRGLESLEEATSFSGLEKAVAPFLMLKWVAKPENEFPSSVVKKHLSLKQGRPQRFLIAIENQLGIEGPFHITAVENEGESPMAVDWCTVEIIDSPFTSAHLTGAHKEFKVIEIVARQGGQHDIRFALEFGDSRAKSTALSTTEQIAVNVESRRRRNKKTDGK